MSLLASDGSIYDIGGSAGQIDANIASYTKFQHFDNAGVTFAESDYGTNKVLETGGDATITPFNSLDTMTDSTAIGGTYHIRLRGHAHRASGAQTQWIELESQYSNPSGDLEIATTRIAIDTRVANASRIYGFRIAKMTLPDTTEDSIRVRNPYKGA